MKKIVGLVKPFDIKQIFYVYEDGNKIDTATPRINDINSAIFALADKYKITKVDLVGPKQYIRGLTKQIQQAEVQKYNENKLEINIV